jgi:release factor glutamine methyltransferase
VAAPETVAAAIQRLARDFTAAGIDAARLDARILVADVLGIAPGEIILRDRDVLAPDAATVLARLATRRVAREPVSRIVGRREFWGLTFEITADVLDPRPDTETVVEAALDARKPDRWPAPRVLDLGTGSGCLLLAILSAWPEATGLGVDRSVAALACAARNAERQGLAARAQFKASDWAGDVTGPFDVVVSNPPYLSARDLAALAPEVGYDPVMALDGGPDGLRAYREILGAIGRILAADGMIALEIGAGQGEQVTAIALRQGLRRVAAKADLAGIERCLCFAA